MGDKSGIEWTDASWNPIVGCSRVSPGCDNCYAISQAHRISAQHEGIREKGGDIDSVYLSPLTVSAERTDWTGEVRVNHKVMDQPLRWKRPRHIFVNSMSDLFHKDVAWSLVGDVFDVMARADWHQYQVLTKRSKRMRDMVSGLEVGDDAIAWPLPNVWLGVSVESDRYKFRIEHLRQTPAAVRWLSIEPLVAPLTLTPEDLVRIDWVVVGGESGHGSRPMHPDWVRGLRDVSVEAGVSFFFKQWGNWAVCDHDEPGAVMVTREGEIGHSIPQGTSPTMFTWMRRHARKKDAGRYLDLVTWDEYPKRTRRRS